MHVPLLTLIWIKSVTTPHSPLCYWKKKLVEGRINLNNGTIFLFRDFMSGFQDFSQI